jgi:hypothetical protein
MTAIQGPNQRPHYYEADAQDQITCGDCGATLAMSSLACTGAGLVTRLLPSPDWVRMELNEIEPEDYNRRLDEKSYPEIDRSWDP